MNETCGDITHDNDDDVDVDGVNSLESLLLLSFCIFIRDVELTFLCRVIPGIYFKGESEPMGKKHHSIMYKYDKERLIRVV